MKVWGLRSTTSMPARRPFPQTPLPFLSSFMPASRASRSTSMNPALCLVLSYSLPGFPSPTISSTGGYSRRSKGGLLLLLSFFLLGEALGELCLYFLSRLGGDLGCRRNYRYHGKVRLVHCRKALGELNVLHMEGLAHIEGGYVNFNAVRYL